MLTAAVLAGCGGGSNAAPAQTTEPSDPPAPLPRGWRAFANAQRGFTLGVPPGWSASGTSATTTLRSGDRGVVAAVAADRSDTGRGADLGGYVTATLHALPGYTGLVASAPRTLGGLHYPAQELDVRGRLAKTGVDQAIRVIALGRPGLVTYTVLLFRNAGVPERAYAAAEAGLLRAFRAQAPPPQP